MILDFLSFIFAIISAVASVATLLVLIIKVTRHITNIEGNIPKQKVELEGKINVLEERIKNCLDTKVPER